MKTNYISLREFLSLVFFLWTLLANAQYNTQKSNVLSPADDITYAVEDTIVELRVSADGDTTYIFRFKPIEPAKGTSAASDNNTCVSSGSTNTSPASFGSETPLALSERSVGKIPFAESVSPTGARMYTIPIATANDCPLKPDVCLTYNSQSGNGAAGYGWGVAAGSAVTVCNLTVYHDGKVAAPDLTRPAECAFMLDGIRLISNTRPLLQYQYETAQGNILVKKHMAGTNIAYFTAAYPNGNTATFGFKDNTVMQTAYPITELADKMGNKIHFSYIRSGNNYYIYKIKYGGKTDGSHTAEINFNYTSRSDFVTIYTASVPISADRLLKSIVSYNSSDDGMEELCTYTLTHNLDGVNRLTQIDCSSGALSLEPLRFEYGASQSQGAKRLELKGNSLVENFFTKEAAPVYIRGKFTKNRYEDGLVTFPGSFSSYTTVEYDSKKRPVFGSGYPADQKILVVPRCDFYNTTESIFTESGFQTIQAVDVNGDGVDELVKVNFAGLSGNYTNLKITIYRNDGSRFSPESFVIPVYGVVDNGGSRKSPMAHEYIFGDFRGDGKTQMLAVSYSMDFMGKSRDSRFTLIDLDARRKLYDNTLFTFDTSGMKFTWTADVDGDGKAELCNVKNSGMDVYSFVDNAFALSSTAGEINRIEHENIVLGDINGDGKTDLLSLPKESYWKEDTLDIPVWAPATCMYCGKEEPIRQFDAMTCRFCGRNLFQHYAQLADIGLLECRACGSQLSNSLSVSSIMEPLCPQDGFTVREYKSTYIDNGDKWTAFISTGCGFVKKEMAILKRAEGDEIAIMDIDRDGMSDIVRTSDRYMYVYVNKSGGFSQMAECNMTIQPHTRLLAANVCNLYGMSNIVSLNDSIISGYAYQKDFCCENLLVGMTDSYGNRHSNDYSDMADGSHGYYSTAGSYSYPYASMVTPLQLLTGSRVYTAQSASSFSDVAFRYCDAVFHSQGLGFVGFKTVTTEDRIANSTSTETRNPLMFGVVTETDTPVKNVSISYTCDTTNGKMSPLPVSTVETDKLKGVSVRTSVSYDTYGNPTQKRTSYGNTLQTLQTAVYENRTSTSYVIGLPASVTVQNLRAGQTWTENTVTAYGDNDLPSSRISYVEGRKTGEARWTYDAGGNVTSEMYAPYDANTFTGTTYVYSKDGKHVVSSTDALGRTTTFSDYDKFGKARTVTDFKNRVTRHTLNTWGEKVSTEYPDGTKETVATAWGGAGLYTVTNTKTGQPTTVTHYDAMAREKRTDCLRHDGKWQKVEKKYDRQGRLYMSSLPFIGDAPAGWNVHEYDVYGRPVSFCEASGRTTTWRYDALTTTETRCGIVLRKTLDEAGELVKVEDAGGVITYTLRPDGQPSAMTAPGGVVTSFGYDGYGRRSIVDDPSFGRQIFTENYSADGTCTRTVTDADRRTVTTLTDRYGRKKKEMRPEFVTEWSYDSDGNITEERSTNGVAAAYAYDAMGRLKTIRKSIGSKAVVKTLEYSNGNIASKTSTMLSANRQPVSVTENYEYSNGTLVRILFGKSATVYELKGMNEFGQVTHIVTGGMAREYGFDAYGQPVSRRAGTIQNESYSFDAQTGNLLSRTDETRHLVETFSYDGLNRLTRMDNAAITYADNGNILNMDGVGEMAYNNTSRPYAVTDLYCTGNYGRIVPQNVRYNSFHCPELVVHGKDSVVLDYDAEGNRVRMSGALQRYYIDEYETADDGKREVLYLGGDAYTAPMAYVYDRRHARWTLVNVCRDYLGSVTQIASISGTLLAEYCYDAWGRMRNPETHEVYADGDEPKLYLGRGFTGHEHLQDFGLVNMNARLYDPELGRFLSPDPYVQNPDFTQSLNRYSYCMNNPLKYVDKDGEWFLLDDLAIGAVGFVFGYACHGIATGHWGVSAVKSGLRTAVATWIGYNTAGLATGAITSKTLNYSINTGVNMILGNIVPSVNIPIGSFDMSLSPLAALGENGFSLGVSTSVYCTLGKFCFGGGFGVTNKYFGWNTSATYDGWGGGYGRTYYGAEVVGGQSLGSQTVGTVSMQFGRNVSFRISNDLWGDREDRWRSSAVELSIGDMSIGTYVTTNNGKEASGYREKGDIGSDLLSMQKEPKDNILGVNSYKKYRDESGKERAKGGTWKNGEIYRAPLWIGLKTGNMTYRYGFSHKYVQSLTQNFVHKYISKTAFFQGTNHFTGGLYSYFGTHSAYSIF